MPLVIYHAYQQLLTIQQRRPIKISGHLAYNNCDIFQIIFPCAAIIICIYLTVFWIKFKWTKTSILFSNITFFSFLFLYLFFLLSIYLSFFLSSPLLPPPSLKTFDWIYLVKLMVSNWDYTALMGGEWIMCIEQQWNENWQEETEEFRENPVSALLCLTQILHRLFHSFTLSDIILPMLRISSRSPTINSVQSIYWCSTNKRK
jgi:hypothetical protein